MRRERRIHKKEEGEEKRERKRTTNDNDRSRGGPERRTDRPLGRGEAKDAGVGAVLREERVELRKAGGLGLRQHERRLHAERHLGALAAWEECGLRLRYHASRVHASAPIQTLTHAAHTLRERGKEREEKKEGQKRSQSCHNSSIQKRKIGKGHSAIRIDALTHLFCFCLFLFPSFFACVFNSCFFVCVARCKAVEEGSCASTCVSRKGLHKLETAHDGQRRQHASLRGGGGDPQGAAAAFGTAAHTHTQNPQ